MIKTKCMTRVIGYLCLMCIMAASQNAISDSLSPFTSDGCSMFPDGTFNDKALWVDCCINHDLAYWAGGTQMQKKQADRALRACVKASGKPQIAKLMYEGVIAGGSPYFPTPYRWGYGWDYLRGYQALTEEEKKEALIQLQKIEQKLKRFQHSLEPSPAK